MSSLAYLKNLPVDYLKIDGQFVRDITSNRIDRAMVQAINQIGHVLGMKTIAEHVETDEILAMVKEMGVDYAQGYATGRPSLMDD
jgi:EAL domain-containing protein (putative c-di-GMP-specific phosphodiesterase class I)